MSKPDQTAGADLHHTESQRRLGVASAVASGLALVLSSQVGTQASDVSPPASLGWHGEIMPVGLVRAERSSEYLWQKDGAIMVFVPAGVFPMGSTDGDADERPVRNVHLDGYYIDKYEVSWAQWKQSGLPYTDRPSSRLAHPEAPDWGIIDDHPVVNVSWTYARKYADWAGKRLPTEAEWEKAARGTDGRRYPWGNEAPTFERAVWRETPIAKISTAAVHCCAPGASPYGALNMAGNVYEWCEDVYGADFYTRAPRRDPINRDGGRYRVLRGGAFLLEREDLRSALRYRLFPGDRADYIGLRTVISQPAPVNAAAAEPAGE